MNTATYWYELTDTTGWTRVSGQRFESREQALDHAANSGQNIVAIYGSCRVDLYCNQVCIGKFEMSFKQVKG